MPPAAHPEISIPFSTIKSPLRQDAISGCGAFQFHLVRLKVFVGEMMGFPYLYFNSI